MRLSLFLLFLCVTCGFANGQFKAPRSPYRPPVYKPPAPSKHYEPSYIEKDNDNMPMGVGPIYFTDSTPTQKKATQVAELYESTALENLHKNDRAIVTAQRELVLARLKHDKESMEQTSSTIFYNNLICYFIFFISHAMLAVALYAAYLEYKQAYADRRKSEGAATITAA